MTYENFEDWKKAVDRVFLSRCFMHTSDLGDAPYRDWYDDGLSPEDAYEEYVDNWDDTGMMAEL